MQLEPDYSGEHAVAELRKEGRAYREHVAATVPVAGELQELAREWLILEVEYEGFRSYRGSAVAFDAMDECSARQRVIEERAQERFGYPAFADALNEIARLPDAPLEE